MGVIATRIFYLYPRTKKLEKGWYETGKTLELLALPLLSPIYCVVATNGETIAQTIAQYGVNKARPRLTPQLTRDEHLVIDQVLLRTTTEVMPV